jgi:hypothetical protein
VGYKKIKDKRKKKKDPLLGELVPRIRQPAEKREVRGGLKTKDIRLNK